MIYKIKRPFFLISHVVLLLLTCSCYSAERASSELKPNQIIEDFINGEFELNQDKRMEYAAYKTGKQFQLGANISPDSSDPTVILSMVADNLIVVRRYDISKVETNADHAEAIVSYDILFESKGNPRTLEKSSHPERVIYELILINGEWKIIDPPLPRVSYDCLISFYKNEISAMQKIVDLGKSSEAQKKLLGRLKADYEILKTE